MSTRARTIGLCAALTLVLAYLIVGVALPLAQQDTRPCQAIEFRIRDHELRQYVSEQELHTLLRQHDIDPVGQPMCTISLDSIEQTIRNHPMIRTAQCHALVSAKVVVNVTQRQPQLKVVTNQHTYYIDSDRLRMPVRESITTPVLEVSGQVSGKMAKNTLYDLTQYLQDQRFWQNRISGIQVLSPHDIRLHQKQAPVILLGDIQDYTTKLHHLERWYRAGADTIGHASYTELDLRFHSLVIARK